MALEALRAKPPETPLLPGRLISAASMARFAIVIEPEVPTTDPIVRRVKVSVPVGVSAAVMLMFPELEPS